MTRFTATTSALAALLATTSMAYAGGVERQTQSPAILFEEGTYAEFGFTYFNPDLSGAQTFGSVGPTLNGSASGDIAPSYTYSSFSYRQDLTEDLSMALIVDSPIGADVDYTPAANGYLYRIGAGSQAEIRSRQFTAALRYELNDNMSVFGGLRAVQASGNVALFNGSDGGAGRYALDAESDYELGYMLGAAYERTDIALRVALTYYSATDHTFTGTESWAAGANLPVSFNTTIPQQVLLEAQSGVAEGTLVFGSVRWTDWTEFEIRPNGFNTQALIAGSPDGGALVDYENDTFTFTLGGARRLSDDLALLASVTYEASAGGFTGNLGPTDGRTSLGLGARYDLGDWRITGGINYTFLGDAVTEAPLNLTGGAPGVQYSSFSGNTGLGIGFRVGYSF